MGWRTQANPALYGFFIAFPEQQEARIRFIELDECIIAFHNRSWTLPTKLEPLDISKTV
jgi:hypothetical protein